MILPLSDYCFNTIEINCKQILIKLFGEIYGNGKKCMIQYMDNDCKEKAGMNIFKKTIRVLCITTLIFGLVACDKATDREKVMTAKPTVIPSVELAVEKEENAISTEVELEATATGAPTVTIEAIEKDESKSAIEADESNSAILTEDVTYDTVTKEIEDTNIRLTVPKEYDYQLFKLSDNEYSAQFTPPNVKTDSVIAIYICVTGFKAAEYDEMKEQNNKIMTQDMYQQSLESTYSPDGVKIEKFSNSDYLTKLGYAFKTECSFVVDGTNETMEQFIYGLDIDNYSFTVNAKDAERIGLDVIAQNILNSIDLLK